MRSSFRATSRLSPRKALLEQEAEVAAKASAAKEAEKAKKEQLEALERRTRDLHEAEMTLGA